MDDNISEESMFCSAVVEASFTDVDSSLEMFIFKKK